MDKVSGKELIIIFFVMVLACMLNSCNITGIIMHKSMNAVIVLTAVTITAVIFLMLRISIHIRKIKRQSQFNR